MLDVRGADAPGEDHLTVVSDHREQAGPAAGRGLSQRYPSDAKSCPIGFSRHQVVSALTGDQHLGVTRPFPEPACRRSGGEQLAQFRGELC
jgi:hypothetical protein